MPHAMAYPLLPKSQSLPRTAECRPARYAIWPTTVNHCAAPVGVAGRPGAKAAHFLAAALAIASQLGVEEVLAACLCNHKRSKASQVNPLPCMSKAYSRRARIVGGPCGWCFSCSGFLPKAKTCAGGSSFLGDAKRGFLKAVSGPDKVRFFIGVTKHGAPWTVRLVLLMLGLPSKG